MPLDTAFSASFLPTNDAVSVLFPFVFEISLSVDEDETIVLPLTSSINWA